MNITDKELRDLLLKENYISEGDLKKAEESISVTHESLWSYLLDKEYITHDLLGQALAEHYSLPYADLNSHQPTDEQVLLIPEATARKFRVVVYSHSANEVVIATDEPDAENLLAELKKVFTHESIRFVYSMAEDIDDCFLHYRQSLKTRFSQIIAQKKRIAPELVEEIFSDALAFRASDIHFEPQDTEVIIRFRVDGLLQEAGRVEKQYYENLLNRIKVLSRLRIDEHFVTQDGALSFKNDRAEVDMRVSIVPTVNGEKAVLRLLSHYVRGFTLKDLGLSEQHEQLVKTVSDKPFGMIMVTGPTGSGKTTTLYSILKTLNSPDINITTIEDPVEYKIPGLNQIQVNTETGVTFARGLRSIVRQDPDVILVGEIRDDETAEISINAALTGHVVLTTFHANDAATAIPRLLKMHVEPFLIASTVQAIVAQRLVRATCQQCRGSYQLDASQVKALFPLASKLFGQKGVRLYRGKGCANCNHSGYRGRVGIFEVIPMTEELKDLIMSSPSAKDIWALVRKQGVKTLFEDGIEKVKRGVTTIDELLRVAEPPTEL